MSRGLGPHNQPVRQTGATTFLLAAVPGFILLGGLLDGRRWLEMLLVGGGFMLQAVFLTLFVSGAWLG
jgi:hypothetical protein